MREVERGGKKGKESEKGGMGSRNICLSIKLAY